MCVCWLWRVWVGGECLCVVRTCAVHVCEHSIFDPPDKIMWGINDTLDLGLGTVNLC